MNGLVVAAQVLDLLLVEEHGSGERGDAGGDDPVHCAMGVEEVVEGEERGKLRLRPWHQLQRRLGDDAERALMAHEQVLEVVARGRLADLLPPPSPTRMISPVGSTISKDITRSRVWPKREPSSEKPLHAIRPPTKEHGVRRRRVGKKKTPYCLSSSLSLSMLMPGPTVTVRSARSISWIWFIRFTSTRIPPRSGTAPSLRPSRRRAGRPGSWRGWPA